ncbi:hypothetical protein EVAR_92284_1 [Eumeta japonica]|uniref:Uncharacterized protein n=1 Tax=Eumeta variegata TaxID=151549 RepID=A0A4C1TLB5_EUMVA|nr:hypothetical protein EVAR_92284_1 [Eumeta japonica]
MARGRHAILGNVNLKSAAAGQPRARRSRRWATVIADDGRFRLRAPSPLLMSFRVCCPRSARGPGSCEAPSANTTGLAQIPLIKFLEQQGYADPQETNDLLDNEVTNSSSHNHDHSVCLFVVSSGKRNLFG